jgi:hypothetical protein
MNYQLFPQTSADVSSNPPLADQYIHATPDDWERYDPGDGVGVEIFSRASRRKRAFPYAWGAFTPGDDGPRG